MKYESVLDYMAAPELEVISAEVKRSEWFVKQWLMLQGRCTTFSKHLLKVTCDRLETELQAKKAVCAEAYGTAHNSEFAYFLCELLGDDNQPTLIRLALMQLVSEDPCFFDSGFHYMPFPTIVNPSPFFTT